MATSPPSTDVDLIDVTRGPVAAGPLFFYGVPASDDAASGVRGGAFFTC